jgi:hypothetical protein
MCLSVSASHLFCCHPRMDKSEGMRDFKQEEMPE